METTTTTAPNTSTPAAPTAPSPSPAQPVHVEEFVEPELPSEFDEELSNDEINPGQPEPGAEPNEGDNAPPVEPQGGKKVETKPAVTAPQEPKPDQTLAVAQTVVDLLMKHGAIKVPEKPKADAKTDEAQAVEEEFKIGLETYEPEVRQEFEKLHKYHSDRYQKMEQRIAQFEQHFAQQAQQAILEEMETVFDSLSGEYGDLIGKGRFESFAEGTPQHKTRLEILNKGAVLAQAYRAEGKPVPRQQQLLTEAARLVLADHHKDVARREVSDAARNRRGQFIQRSATREQPALSTREIAVRNAAKLIRQQDESDEEPEL